MQGLLSEAMPQDMAMAPEEAMSDSTAGMSDVDMAVNDAVMGGGMDNMGFGVEMASEEEQEKLEIIMDGIEKEMHGKMSDQIVGMIENSPDVANGISTAAHTIIVGSFMAANKQGIEPGADVYLGENGVIQETVELVYEFAEAMNRVTGNPDEVLSAAYLDTLRKVGETLLNVEDPEIRESAQELLAELELGMPVEPSDYAEAEELGMLDQAMSMEEQMAQEASQSVSGPLPSLGPEQGMI